MPVGYVGLVKIDLPGHTAYLSDGGFITWDGNTYTSSDSVLGNIASVDSISEGASGEIPALQIGFNIPSGSSISALSSGALQNSDFRMWLAKYDVDTNAVVGTPELQFLGQIDQPVISIRRGEFTASLTVVSKAEWFFEGDIGNGLSSTFHKDLYPGELGHDNATGLQVTVSWGVKGPSPAMGGRFTNTWVPRLNER